MKNQKMSLKVFIFNFLIFSIFNLGVFQEAKAQDCERGECMLEGTTTYGRQSHGPSFGAGGPGAGGPGGMGERGIGSGERQNFGNQDSPCASGESSCIDSDGNYHYQDGTGEWQVQGSTAAVGTPVHVNNGNAWATIALGWNSDQVEWWNNVLDEVRTSDNGMQRDNPDVDEANKKMSQRLKDLLKKIDDLIKSGKLNAKALNILQGIRNLVVGFLAGTSGWQGLSLAQLSRVQGFVNAVNGIRVLGAGIAMAGGATLSFLGFLSTIVGAITAPLLLADFAGDDYVANPWIGCAYSTDYCNMLFELGLVDVGKGGNKGNSTGDGTENLDVSVIDQQTSTASGSGGFASGCVDGDASKQARIFVPSHVIHNGVQYYDTCSDDGDDIFEMSCSADGNSKISKKYDCRYGCEAGACKPEPKPEYSNLCVDSDGKDKYTKGFVTFKGVKYTDSCVTRSDGTQYMSEYFCSSDNRYKHNQLLLCKNGCSMMYGKCL